ncbi:MULTISPECIES: hypothetical protein [Myxococcus]|uniref:Uncharacterized protein n=1 Tax=Myxococcus xanthus TaxID=34 RepID=A0AAE6FXF5_MYXXA|nr:MULTISPECIES: hypothetical protein [Myxococcus]QDE67091.1 hypothetical protein BHS09_08785 [Myxococcus xanthus]QDE74365.1 hypothetical protein BHS08_08795 [Myxococcus xanthus]WAM28221.1 hypothetical protein OZ403_08860 [Myxococcus sp. NMCA1]
MATNLTGTWLNQGPDGGTYKILQVGTVIFWRGENKSAGWSNIGFGSFDEQHNMVSITWGDPDGGNTGNHGFLLFTVADNNLLKKVGGLGGGDFKRS